MDIFIAIMPPIMTIVITILLVVQIKYNRQHSLQKNVKISAFLVLIILTLFNIMMLAIVYDQNVNKNFVLAVVVLVVSAVGTVANAILCGIFLLKNRVSKDNKDADNI